MKLIGADTYVDVSPHNCYSINSDVYFDISMLETIYTLIFIEI